METKKTSVLFVCHGNICRSPMAEIILRRMATRAGIADRLNISSAATSDEETGNPIYPLAKRVLAVHGIGCQNKVAQKMTVKMFKDSDIVVAMDNNNVNNIINIVGDKNADKIHLLLDYISESGLDGRHEVSDPWYTRDFDKAYTDITAGCKALLEYLKTTLGVTEE